MLHRFSLRLAIIVSVVTWTFGSLCWSQYLPPLDPWHHYKRLETAHFEIIYAEEQRSLALRYAKEAERAYGELTHLLDVASSDKIDVVLADVTDDSNGDASSIPRPTIEIYPVLPSVNDPTSEYYDWAREVITHEETHILNFEPTSGIFRVLRTLFGSIAKPNNYLPHWYLEGQAVEMESRFTPIGRGRSHFYSALVRAWTEDRTWGDESIDRLQSTSIPTWPRGQRPYTYGYFLMHDLSLESPEGEHIYGLLDNDYGGHMPWFINGPVEHRLGKDYEGLLEAMYARYGKAAKNDLDAIKKSAPKPSETPPSPLNNTTAKVPEQPYQTFGAQISPDGLKLAAIAAAPGESSSIRLWIRDDIHQSFRLIKEPRIVTKQKGIHQIAWRADSTHLIYDHRGTVRHFYTYSDLYELNALADKNIEGQRLTHGLRAREATVLKDDSLVFIVADANRTILYHSDPHGEHAQAIVTPEEGERLSAPRAYKDGVIFSHRDNQGHEWLETWDTIHNGIKPLTESKQVGQQWTSPAPDYAGHGLYAVLPDDQGVINVVSVTNKKWITHETTAAYSPCYDSGTGEILYSRLTSTGIQLVAATPIKGETVALNGSSSVKTLSLHQPELEALLKYPEADTKAANDVKIENEDDYNGLSYLMPRYIIPFFYFVPDGMIFNLNTSNADPLNTQQYALSLGYDTRAQQATQDLVYTNATHSFLIDGLLSNDYEYIVGANQTFQFFTASIDTRHYFIPDSEKWTIGPNITYRITNIPGFYSTEFGPGASVSYDNVEQPKDYQISPEKGESFDAGYGWYPSSDWGNTVYQNWNFAGSYYLSGGFLPKHHVISVKASGWLSNPFTTIDTGIRQAGGEVMGSILPQQFIVRGYAVGEFLANNLLNSNLEYRFPISYSYHGNGTLPAFVNKWYAAVIMDTATLDGIYYNYDSSTNTTYLVRTNLGRQYYVGTGAELRADLLLFYGFPLTGRAGVYYGLNTQAFGGWNYYLGFGLIE